MGVIPRVTPRGSSSSESRSRDGLAERWEGSWLHVIILHKACVNTHVGVIPRFAPVAVTVVRAAVVIVVVVVIVATDVVGVVVVVVAVVLVGPRFAKHTFVIF